MNQAIVEQGNADYWAAQARAYVQSMHQAQERGASEMTDYFRKHALAAQEYAWHAHGMVLYRRGLAPFPTVL